MGLSGEELIQRVEADINSWSLKMKPIKFIDVVNWYSVISIVGLVVTVGLLVLSHFGHVSILDNKVANSASNWNTVNGELYGGLISAFITLVSTWFGTKGKAAVSLNNSPPAKASEDETVDILLQKIAHRCRKDAADSILKAGGVQ